MSIEKAEIQKNKEAEVSLKFPESPSFQSLRPEIQSAFTSSKGNLTETAKKITALEKSGKITKQDVHQAGTSFTAFALDFSRRNGWEEEGRKIASDFMQQIGIEKSAISLILNSLAKLNFLELSPQAKLIEERRMAILALSESLEAANRRKKYEAKSDEERKEKFASEKLFSGSSKDSEFNNAA